VYQYILDLGFSKDKISDHGDYYLVDGDIKFDKFSNAAKGARPSHSTFSGRPIVNYDAVDDITVRVEDNFGTNEWYDKVTTATARAVTNWNDDVNNTNLHLTYTAGPNATITVKFRNLSGTGYYGIGAFPVNCNAGPTVDLGSSTSGMSLAQLEYLITHELGHCVGFRHTNEGSNQGNHVPGTPYTETASIMNSAGATEGNTVPNWSAFSSGDLTAVSVVYPPYAYADGNDLDPTTNTINFKWTIAYFCSSTVKIVITNSIGTIINSVNASNTGQFSFSAGAYNPGETYEFEVSDPNDSSRLLYTSVSF
jgi:hypothetical protein